MIPNPERLRSLRVICLALAAAVGVYAALSWLLLRVLEIEVAPGLPPAVPLTLTALAMILILLSSRLRTTLLGRAFPRPPLGPPVNGGMKSAGLAVSEEAMVAAYRQATLVSFALLEGAGLLGLVVALLSGKPFYGLALCAAALLAMATRWPSESEIDRILRGRRGRLAP
jgi:hypothetical protein